MTRANYKPDTQILERRAWEYAVEMGVFTNYGLSARVHDCWRRTAKLIASWEARGKIVRVTPPNYRKVAWRVADSSTDHLWPPVERPASAAGKGKQIAAGMYRSPKENMWNAMRHLSQFTYFDVQTHANTDAVRVDEDEARDYCRLLFNAGYLLCVRKARPQGLPALYRLVRDTGRQAPRERRVRAVWDENLGQYTHVPEPRQ